jgi:hypothetical protein
MDRPSPKSRVNNLEAMCVNSSIGTVRPGAEAFRGDMTRVVVPWAVALALDGDRDAARLRKDGRRRCGSASRAAFNLISDGTDAG